MVNISSLNENEFENIGRAIIMLNFINEVGK